MLRHTAVCLGMTPGSGGCGGGWGWHPGAPDSRCFLHLVLPACDRHRKGGERPRVFVNGQLESIGQQRTQHQPGGVRRRPCGRFRDHRVTIQLEPARTAGHFLRFDAMRDSDQIDHRRVVQLVAAIADRVAGHPDVDLPVADANISDIEPGAGLCGLAERRPCERCGKKKADEHLLDHVGFDVPGIGKVREAGTRLQRRGRRRRVPLRVRESGAKRSVGLVGGGISVVAMLVYGLLIVGLYYGVAPLGAG